MSILNHFPYDIPRDGQRQVLEKIERLANFFDVFIIVAPTASGKEAMGTTLVEWNGSGTMIVPNNLLVQQVAGNSGLTTIRNKHTYKHQWQYIQARAALKGGKCVLNYYQYMANKAYNNVLVVDEAHKLINFLQDKETVKLWGHLDGFEEGQFRTTEDLMLWLDKHPKKGGRIEKARNQLMKEDDRYILEESIEMYRGHARDCLKLIPLTPRDNKPILWPPHRVNKIVLMSATFNEEDLYDLGLDRKRVCKLEIPSPIPAENRPIVFLPVANMSHKHQAASIPKVAAWVEQAMTHHISKGLLHATYSVASKLRGHLKHDRIMYHTHHNIDEVYGQWLNSDPAEGKVLVGCGMTEGLSLDDDLCRWQAILKISYPNLAEPAVAAKLKQRPESYQWAAIKHVVQAAGRVCRSPEDRGITYIVDDSFSRLYKTNREMFPQFFQDALEVHA